MVLSLGEGSLSALDNAHNDSEQPQGAPEDLDDQNLDEAVGVLRIGDRAARPRDPDADAT